MGSFGIFSCVVLTLAAGGNAEYLDPHCDGKQVIVHLFEWKWSDIAAECERFLGPWGYCGVQVSPPMEHVIITNPPYPWWERYQPVSYKILSRSGNEQEFADMTKRCNKVGVRIIVDAVVNHMTDSALAGVGTDGSHYDGRSFNYPGVPYTAENFNTRKCTSGCGCVDNMNDPKVVRNCKLVPLNDLDQSQEYVRLKISGYFNHLINLGVAGFRVDASKHMWPSDILAIQEKTINTHFGGKGFFYHEVVDLNQDSVKVTEYYPVGRVTEFRYSLKIAQAIQNFGLLRGVFDSSSGMSDSDHALIFVDNHDIQRGKIFGEGQILTHQRPLEYKLAVAFTLAWNYGFTRVMSSYAFGTQMDVGPPHNADYSTANVLINSDSSCGGGWVCEHRWPSIKGMTLFRNAVVGTDVKNYNQDGDVVGFSRGNKGFFAMGKQGFDKTFQTGLPAGQYCDLISNCQQKILVEGNGNAHLRPFNTQDPIVAIIVGGPRGPISDGSGLPVGTTLRPVTTREPQHTTPGGLSGNCDSAWSSAGNSGTTTSAQYKNPHCNGKQVIVHLFEWKWTDIAAECERYLGPKGFCGVQISPPTEHVIVNSGEAQRPWWEYQQPVSYKLNSRSGTEEQLADMIKRCNAVGVRIFSDAVINHMTGTERSGVGLAGSPFNGGAMDYPAVPYTAANFNSRSKCPTGSGKIENYGDAQQVRNCEYLTLGDLDQSQPHVRDMIVNYLNHLIQLGVAGFRIDSAKYMWPTDLEAIQTKIKDTQFGGRPFFYHEVIDLGDGAVKSSEYTKLGYVTEFKYCSTIARGIQDFSGLRSIGATSLLNSNEALVFVDDFENQRGHGSGGNVLTFKQPADYQLAQAFTLAWNYGFTRVISSYRFDNADQGPPDNEVTINQDGTCGGNRVCEHRWPAIGNMVTFRNHVTGTDINHYVQTGNVVAFARGRKGFFAMGKGGFRQTFQTGLPAGQYCDLISNCQQKVTLDQNGNAELSPYSNEHPIVAFVVDGPQNGCNGNIRGGREIGVESGTGSDL